MAKAPTVFISYSWDSKSHKRWVERLALKLTNVGLTVILDQWDLHPGESLTSFMERGIKASGHVLVICTPTYAARSNSRTGGVGYEQQMISAQIAEGVPRRKFIPVVRAGEYKAGKNCAIPAHFGGIFALDMRTTSASRGSFTDLVETIWKGRGGGSALKKPTGARSSFKRLSSLELDGWELSSGVVAHERAPKTFYIPTMTQRQSVRLGDFVKLIFKIAEDDEGEDVNGERMWVRVTGTHGPYFAGTLANRPLSQRKNLQFGTRVPFLAEHIIDIDRPE